MLQSAISTAHYPNVNAIVLQESSGNATHENQLVAYTQSPALNQSMPTSAPHFNHQEVSLLKLYQPSKLLDTFLHLK